MSNYRRVIFLCLLTFIVILGHLLPTFIGAYFFGWLGGLIGGMISIGTWLIHAKLALSAAFLALYRQELRRSGSEEESLFFAMSAYVDRPGFEQVSEQHLRNAARIFADQENPAKIASLWSGLVKREAGDYLANNELIQALAESNDN